MLSIMKTKEELKIYYESLTGKYEGYIQMSDSRFKDEHLLYTKKGLPSWERLHYNNIRSCISN